MECVASAGQVPSRPGIPIPAKPTMEDPGIAKAEVEVVGI